jgi:hypothetical protein
MRKHFFEAMLCLAGVAFLLVLAAWFFLCAHIVWHL